MTDDVGAAARKMGLLKTALLIVDWRLHAFLLQSRVVDSRIIKFCLWLQDMYFKRDCCQTCCFHAVALKTYDGTRCCAARTTYTSTGFWKLLITTRCNHECIQAGASWRWSLAVLLFWRAQIQSSSREKSGTNTPFVMAWCNNGFPLITGHHVNKGNHKSSLALTNISKTLIHVLKFSLDLIIFTLHDGAQGNHT